MKEHDPDVPVRNRNTRKETSRQEQERGEQGIERTSQSAEAGDGKSRGPWKEDGLALDSWDGQQP